MPANPSWDTLIAELKKLRPELIDQIDMKLRDEFPLLSHLSSDGGIHDRDHFTIVVRKYQGGLLTFTPETQLNPTPLKDKYEQEIKVIRPKRMFYSYEIGAQELKELYSSTYWEIFDNRRVLIDGARKHIADMVENFMRMYKETQQYIVAQLITGNSYEGFSYAGVQTYTPPATWDSSTADPLKDIEEMVKMIHESLSRYKLGIRRYEVLMGADVSDVFLRHPAVEKYASALQIQLLNYKKTNDRLTTWEMEEIASYRNIPIITVRAMYDNGGTASYVLPPNMVIVYAQIPKNFTFEYSSIAKFSSTGDIKLERSKLQTNYMVSEDKRYMTIEFESWYAPILRFPQAFVKAQVLP